MYRMNRRNMLRASGVAVGGTGLSGWFPALADQLAVHPQRRRHAILLWMSGGPSQTDTFDLKPGHENGGPFQEIQTNSPAVRFSEHLPLLSAHADKLAIVRSLSTKEGDHSRGTHLMRTGHSPTEAEQHPAISAALAKELGSEPASLPHYVSIAPMRGFSQSASGPGYLGPKFGPLVVAGGSAPHSHAEGTYASLTVDSILPPAGVSAEQTSRRLVLWEQLQERFLREHTAASPKAHQTVYRGAVNLMRTNAAQAFDLDEEPAVVREKYGNGVFGQGCLMARRLVERGVSFVEVTLNGNGGGPGWDTHANNFETVAALSAELDAGWSSLMEDLESRDLLSSTTILWMGEFGRTPQINGQSGRDHFPSAWSCVFAGGGIAGGQAYGRTSEDGQKVVEGKVGVTEVLATLCSAVGVNPETKNLSDAGRPLPIVDGAPIDEILT